MVIVRILGVLSALALLTVWFGYPLVIHALARRRLPRERRPPGPLPRVSVVIATRDAPEAILARVSDVLATDYELTRLEVIVAVDQSAAPLAHMREFPRPVSVVIGDLPGGKAATLNAGVRAASGDILVFSDTFQRFDAAAIRHLVGAFDDERVGAASGALELPPHASAVLRAYWRMERRLRLDEAQIGSVIGVTGAIYAMRHALWEPLPAGLILDDLYGPMRLVLKGHRIDFVEVARAVESRVTSAAEEYRRKVRTLTGNFQLCAWLPSVLSPARNPVWVQFMLHKILRLATPYWMVLTLVWVVAETLNVLPGAALMAAGGGALMLALWLWQGKSRLARRGKSLVTWVITLQGAVVRGTYFGFRRRWEVW